MNADGTITDTNTRLVWEKQSADGTIHDQDNAYDWPEAAAVVLVRRESPTWS